MKKTLPLSLLLLIAGNGLMVTQVHAGFFGRCKNQALQIALNRDTQKSIGGFCLTGGVICLVSAGLASPVIQKIFKSWEVQRDYPRLSNKDKENFTEALLECNETKNKNYMLKTLAAGIPLTALGVYLYFKK